MYYQPPPYPQQPAPPYPQQPAPPPLNYQQYHNAYPVFQYNQPPSAYNGYGWHGNGYGWQLDPQAWYTPPGVYPRPDHMIEEPPVQAQKVEKANASYSPVSKILFYLKTRINSISNNNILFI